MSRQPHPDGAKRQARQLYEVHGSRRAAELTGLSRRTINEWARVEGWQRRLATKQPSDQHATPVADTLHPDPKRPVAIGYQLRRQRQLDRYAELVDQALDKAKESMEANRPYWAKAYAVTAAVFSDKVELLAKSIHQLPGGELPDPVTAVIRLDGMLDIIEGRASG